MFKYVTEDDNVEAAQFHRPEVATKKRNAMKSLARGSYIGLRYVNSYAFSAWIDRHRSDEFSSGTADLNNTAQW